MIMVMIETRTRYLRLLRGNELALTTILPQTCHYGHFYQKQHLKNYLCPFFFFNFRILASVIIIVWKVLSKQICK